MRISSLAISALFLTLAAPAAHGEDFTRRIEVTQADLSSEAAVAGLYRRVETAARAVCSESYVMPTAYDLASRRACVAETLETAVAQANLPALSAYHLAATAEPFVSETLASR
ncbi:MAG: UrcA family protein [Hyphomonadaceae bacterium]